MRFVLSWGSRYDVRLNNLRRNQSLAVIVVILIL